MAAFPVKQEMKIPVLRYNIFFLFCDCVFAFIIALEYCHISMNTTHKEKKLQQVDTVANSHTMYCVLPSRTVSAAIVKFLSYFLKDDVLRSRSSMSSKFDGSMTGPISKDCIDICLKF